MVSSMVFTASEAGSSDDEAPGQSNTWCPLLEAVYERFLGHVPLQQGCFVAVVPLRASWTPVARASTDRFFTFCDVHLAQERDSQSMCLQRRHG